jgi:hypothetical protein
MIIEFKKDEQRIVIEPYKLSGVVGLNINQVPNDKNLETMKMNLHLTDEEWELLFNTVKFMNNNNARKK